MADPDPTNPSPEAADVPAAPGESPPADQAAVDLTAINSPNESQTSIDAELAAAQASIDELLSQAQFDDPSSLGADPSAANVPFDLPAFQQAMAEAQVSNIDLLRDVELNVKIELGRSRMLVEDVLKLAEGSVVELDKLAGDPVDVFVNDRLVARGEVLVLNDNFCVRVNEIMAGAKEEGL